MKLSFDPFFEPTPIKSPKGVKVYCKEAYAQSLFDLYMSDTGISIDLPIVGDTYNARITNTNSKWAQVDLGTKYTGYIDLEKENLKAEYLTDLLKSTTIPVTIKQVDENKNPSVIVSHITFLNNNKSAEIKLAIDDNTVYSAKVIEIIDNGGFWVSINDIKCFMPGSLAGINKLINFNELIGKTLNVIPVSFSNEKNSIIVSHKKYLETLIPEQIKELDKTIKYVGTITGTTSFGVFVEFNKCLTGMIHKTDLCEESAKQFANGKFKPGDSLEFKVKEILSNRKIILTQIENWIDPWVNIKYKETEVLNVKIKEIKSYGLFCEIEPGLIGLYAILDKTKIDTYKVGNLIKLEISKLDKENRKIFFIPERKRKVSN